MKPRMTVADPKRTASAGGRPQWGQPNQTLAALGLGRIEAATAKKPD
jgi:hypothetical protein